MRALFAAALAACLALTIGIGLAKAQSGLPHAVPVAPVSAVALPPPASPEVQQFDALKATNAYLAQVHGAARVRSDSYFEGGYVLILVDTVYAVAVSAILLWLGISAGMMSTARAVTGSRFFQASIYVLLYTALVAALTFPLTVYEEFFREHAYDLSNQTFPQWFQDFATGFAVNLVASTILLSVIYAVVRAARRTWWVWGSLVVIVGLGVGSTVFPVFVAPLFNHYTPLPETPLKSQILSLARSEGIPVTNVYEFDASKQSKRVSANVSGLFGTTRISMTDNLLKRCTPDMVKAVLGHEMGHYVLNHQAIGMTWLGLLFFLGFAFVNWGFGVLQRSFGKAWGVEGIDDPAGLPALMALFAVYTMLATPAFNTVTRTTEAQADIFGLNAARQPDGFAKSALMLSEYRKLDPTPLEEFVFFDHPSGRSRIFMSMRWKAEHLNDPDIKAGPVSPQ